MFSKVHSCENVRVKQVFAGGDHSFIILNHNLNGDEIEVPDAEIVEADENLLDGLNTVD